MYKPEANRKREVRQAASEIGEIPDVVNPLRKESCRYDLELFLTTYQPNSFYRPFSKDQKVAIKKIQTAILEGGTFAEAMPRGTGKTTIIEGAVEWAECYGHRKYVVVIGATGDLAEQILDDIKAEFETNDLLLEDFPEICFPVRALEGVAQRCGSQTCGGVRTQIDWKAKEVKLPTIEGSESSGGIIESVGITGSVRGRKAKVKDEHDPRPDFVVLDDPQTRESAENQRQVDKRERIIQGDVMGLAGHDKNIAAVMPCTVVCKGDLADRFLDHKINPAWQGHRTKLVYKWPDKDKDVWLKEYAELYEDEMEAHGTHKAATEFYEKNREEMDKGAEVCSEHLYAEGEISAIQHAYNLLLTVKEFAFHAEYQNDPDELTPSLYDITPEVICSKISDYPRNTAPENAPFITAFIDINYSKSGLSWVVAAFENNLTGWILDYGRYPDWEAPLWSKEQGMIETPPQAIWRGLSALVPQLFATQFTRNDKPVRLDAMMIDCGFEQDTVLRYVHQARMQNLPIMPSRGRAASKYRLPPKNRIKGRPGTNWHTALWQGKGAVAVHNADWWRVHVQKAFLMAKGSPSSCNLYKATPKQHYRIAQHVTSEKLIEYKKGDLTDFYLWQLAVGQQNDLLDCLVGCYVAAAMSGAGGVELGGGRVTPNGAPRLPQHRRGRRSTNVEL